MTNPVLKTIRDRRSVLRFETVPIEEEKIQSILEAGRWAPSWLNRQPWRFILIDDREIRELISEHVPTIYNQGMREAPICIAVCVNPEEDPYHFVEDGAVATQNMALTAHSLGLGSCWIGIFDWESKKNSAEERIKKTLNVPVTYRVISLLPLGVPKHVPEKSRKKLSRLVYRNRFQKSM